MRCNIFREYDIRGIVAKEFTIEEIFDLTKAIISYFKQKQPNLTTIIIGSDGRTHSPKIKEQAFLAATEMGINVIDIGLVPTPTFYFSLHTLNFSSGFIITASHNPKEYNGIKICFDKKSVWGQEIQRIRQIWENKDFYIKTTNQKGNVINCSIIPEYIEWIANHFEHLKNMKTHVVIDCGNGTAGTIFPQLIKKMNWRNIKLLFEAVDGTFPNHEADPTSYKNMQTVYKELKNNPNLELGIGLDGDCDRMSPMTKSGFLVPGDQLLAIYSKEVLKKHPNAPIVFDIKSSSGLIQLLQKWGAQNIISPSGHSLIKDALTKNNALLAGELSCHFFFKDRYFGYDDGIYAALRLFEIIQESGKNLDELLKVFPQKVSSREIRIECTEETKTKIVKEAMTFFAAKKDAQAISIDGIRAQMPYGWGLIRASNTQPVICLRFESDTQEGMKKVKEDFYNAIKPAFNEKTLKKAIDL